MYLVTCYNYNTKTNNELAVGSKRNMESFIEEYCYEYINSLQGKRIDNLLIKKNNDKLTTTEWNNNIRVWVSKSNNQSKYTIKKMEKIVGYLSNSYPITKLLNIYLIKIKDDPIIEQRESEMCDVFAYNFDEVIQELQAIYDTKENYKEVMNEIKNM